MADELQPTQRFSDRARDYDRFRPSYPTGLIDALADAGMGAGAEVADIGAGTGIFSGLLLDAGCRVTAVEPNAEMRAVAGARLGSRPGLTIVSGTAEDTGLADASIDGVTCAQAFHWFDAAAARRELIRITRSPAPVGLIWNDRLSEADTFMAAYEELLARWGTDYAETTYKYRAAPATIEAFFGGPPRTLDLPNSQRLDSDGLLGRFFSSSFTPARTDPAFAAARRDLKELFDRYAQDGEVVLRYRTRLYLGELSS